MGPVRTAILALLLVPLLQGCIISSDDNGTLNRISFGNGQVTVHAQGEPDAIVTSDGQLLLNGKPVAVNASQQALLRQYHAAVLQLRADGAAVGSAGIKVASKAIGGAIRGVLGGDPDQIEAGVEAEAERVEASVAILCDQLNDVHVTGNQVAATLPQFDPYASIELGDCRKQRDG